MTICSRCGKKFYRRAYIFTIIRMDDKDTINLRLGLRHGNFCHKCLKKFEKFMRGHKI